ncbi:UNVERIFIED_CONTAM: hypothetical protein FKN15_019665 [Acipenser sinensis]
MQMLLSMVLVGQKLALEKLLLQTAKPPLAPQQSSCRGSRYRPYLCCRDTPAEGVFLSCLSCSNLPAEGVGTVLTCVAEILQQRVSSCLACLAAIFLQRESVPSLPVLQRYSSRGCLLVLPVLQQSSCRGSRYRPYLCCRDTPAEGVFLSYLSCSNLPAEGVGTVLTCVAEILQQRVSSCLTCLAAIFLQRESVPSLPVLQRYSSRGCLCHSYLCYSDTPGEGVCSTLTSVADIFHKGKGTSGYLEYKAVTAERVWTEPASGTGLLQQRELACTCWWTGPPRNLPVA